MLRMARPVMTLRKTLFATAVLLVACGAAPSPTPTSAPAPTTLRPSAPALAGRPFLLGAFVGANMHDWGDIANMGADSTASNRAIAADLRDLGCNAVWVTGFAPFYADTPLIGTWLDAARENGLLAVIEGAGYPYAIPRDGEVAGRVERARQDVIPAWRSIARAYRGHPALLAWSPVEEIDDNVENGEDGTIRALAEVGRAVAEVDPAHPVVTIHIAHWINVAEAEARLRGENLRTAVFDLYVFADVHDWTSEGYAYRTNQEATQGILDWTARYEEFGRRHRVPIWAMLQSNETRWVRRTGPNGAPEERSNFRMPGAAEMRFQVWAAVLSGIKGVFFFQYGSNPPPPEETRSTLAEWEYGIGMRTLEGEPTASHAGLREAAAEIGPHLALLGRLEPTGDRIEEGSILARAFSDPSDGRTHIIVVNRDLAAARPVPAGLAARLGIAAIAPLPPGGGAIVEVSATR